MRRRSPSDPAMVLILLSIIGLLVMALAGCKAFRGAAAAVATTGSPTAAAGSLLTPAPATDPKVIEDLIADRMDEFDASYDRRQMVEAGLDPKCASWEALVQEGRIAPIMHAYFCRPSPPTTLVRSETATCPTCPECPMTEPPQDLVRQIIDAGGQCDGGKDGSVRCRVVLPMASLASSSGY